MCHNSPIMYIIIIINDIVCVCMCVIYIYIYQFYICLSLCRSVGPTVGRSVGLHASSMQFIYLVICAFIYLSIYLLLSKEV